MIYVGDAGVLIAGAGNHPTQKLVFVCALRGWEMSSLLGFREFRAYVPGLMAQKGETRELHSDGLF